MRARSSLAPADILRRMPAQGPQGRWKAGNRLPPGRGLPGEPDQPRAVLRAAPSVSGERLRVMRQSSGPWRRPHGCIFGDGPRRAWTAAHQARREAIGMQDPKGAQAAMGKHRGPEGAQAAMGKHRGNVMRARVASTDGEDDPIAKGRVAPVRGLR